MSQQVTMRIAGKSNVKNIAGSIVKHWQEGNEIEIITVGAGALNQSAKAIAASSGILATKGREVLVKLGFTEVTIDGKPKTAIRQALIIK